MSYRIVYLGSSDFGLPSLAAIAADPRFEVVAVVTQPAKPQSRGQSILATPIAEWAAAQSIQTFTPTTLRDQAIQDQLKELKPDVFVVIAYGLILPAEVLSIPMYGSVNVHASLLPRHRGASPIVASILNGDEQTGVSIMQMDAGIDTGPVIAAAATQISPQETTLTLAPKLSQLAAATLPDALAGFLRGELVATPQPTDGATYAPKLSREDGHATWDSVVVWERKIRAFQPWPGVWANWNGTVIKILAATAHAGKPTEPPGTIVAYPAGSWSIACADGWLEPTEVQLAGRKAQAAKQFPGSYPNVIGSRLD